jgi:hypothetical protein
MSVQFGSLSATFNKKMELLASKVLIALIGRDSNMNALFARKPKVGQQSNVKTVNVVNIIILNVLVKKRFTCNSLI